MKRILVVFGTRPEAIKLLPVIRQLRKQRKLFKIIVCSTAQHREMLDQILKDSGFQIDYDLNIMKRNQNLFDISRKALGRFEIIFKKERLDFLLIQGDTTTTLMAAMAAFYSRIPIGHIEAGLRSGDKNNPYPEELNRKLVSHLADFHFAPTDLAKKNLIKEGIKKTRIFVTGNTGVDALKTIKIGKRPLPKSFFLGNRKLILLTCHRRENWGEPLLSICLAVKRIVKENPDVSVVFPVHLNPRVRKIVFQNLKKLSRVHLLDPLDYKDFLFLMSKCYFILTDSGGIQEEAPSFGKPVLVLRKVSERPEAIQLGFAKIIGTNQDNIYKQAEILLKDKAAYKKMLAKENPFGQGNASLKIMKILKDILFDGSKK